MSQEDESHVIYDIIREKLIPLMAPNQFEGLQVIHEFLNVDQSSDASAKVKFMTKFLDKNGVLDHSQKILKIPKNDKISDECRNQGNKLYAKNDYIKAVTKYNESLCYAESQSNLALAYANRSAICFELQMFQTCIQNIELAKSHGYPAEKMTKLDLRAEKCRRLIAEGTETDENLLNCSGEEFLKLSHPPHPKLPYIADCLEVKINRQFGRHVITNKRLLPGDIVCIEPPFNKSLLRNRKYNCCTNCMDDTFLSLIPCPVSTAAMFCSQKCKDEAFESSYKYKVDIIDELHRICPKVFLLGVETFFKALKICDGNVEKLIEVAEENKSNPVRTILDVNDPNDPIDVFRAIDSLGTHESDRITAQRFIIFGSVAMIADLFLNHTKLADVLKTEEDKDFFRGFLLKHTQIAMVNGHGFGKCAITKAELEEVQSFPGSTAVTYPFLSLISHSCSPNVSRFGNNKNTYILVVQVIEPGEQLFDCYAGTFDNMDLTSRQAHLKENYCFDCKCVACTKRFTTFNYLPEGFKDDKSRSKFIYIKNKVDKDYNLDVAKKVLTKIQDLLVQKKSMYPCKELVALQHNLRSCFSIFSMSNLQLRLLHHKN